MINPLIGQQAGYWDKWNEQREGKLNEAQERQSAQTLEWISELQRRDLELLDVGCGAGWMSGRLQSFGKVTGIDFTEKVITRARMRYPGVNFICNSFDTQEFPAQSFDVIVSLEVLAHVPNQQAFIEKCAMLLRPYGVLIISTQNCAIFKRMENVAPPSPDQIRHWLTVSELKNVIHPYFETKHLTSILPDGHAGFLRIVNSPKLNSLLAKLFSESTIKRWKERAMLGRIQMLHAARRA